MIHIKIYTPGKEKYPLFDPAIQEYIKRLKAVCKIEMIHPKDNEDLLKKLEKEQNIFYLDANGQSVSSEEFAGKIEGKSRLAFVIGEAEGLPKELKGKPGTISLSKMTFTHQMVRLLLIEQIYRAFEILKGSDYHK